ncbi:MAG: hypothetical protein HY775_00225, partial [Acidobacteria bacterium]|nr:hypothetical protein [Acidobacteriota bacterium]
MPSPLDPGPLLVYLGVVLAVLGVAALLLRRRARRASVRVVEVPVTPAPP